MNSLHFFLHKAITQACTGRTAYVFAIRHIFKAKSISISDNDVDHIVDRILNNDLDRPFDLDLDVDIDKISISDEEMDAALREFENVITKVTKDAIQEVTTSEVPKLVDDIYKRCTRLGRSLDRATKDFEDNIQRVWGRAIANLEILIDSSRNFNDMFRDGSISESSACKDHSPLRLAVGSLHLRACRTAMEILALIRCGFADGALARWRSLYELSILAMFISEHGSDLAQRYLDHAAIERFKSMLAYREHSDALGFASVSSDETKSVEEEAAKMIAKYGKSFAQDYGWASAILGKKVSFKAIEAALNLKHWRVFYQLACHSIHGGAQAGIFSLSMFPGDTIYSGPTLAGLCDPGQNCAISMAMAAVAIMSVDGTLDAIVICRALSQICDDTVGRFVEAHQFLEDHLITDDEVREIIGDEFWDELNKDI